MSAFAGRRAGAAWLLSAGVLLSSGCAVDLLVGGAMETGTTGTAATDDEGTTAEAAADTSTGPAASSTGAEASDTSTGSHADTTAGETAGPTTTTGATEESTTTGPLGCEGLGFADCNEVGHCLWYDDPELGECLLSPCEMPLHQCWELPFGDCNELLACAWVGEPDTGECGPIECVPCELLNPDQCEEAPTCAYDGMERVCLPAPD